MVPKPYPAEFRRRALDLVESGRPAWEVAAALGIAESCLYRWRSQDLIARGIKTPAPRAAASAELAAAQARIKNLEDEVKILRKAAAAVEAVVPPKDRYRLVAELAEDGVEVKKSCLALGVSRSGYYEARTRAPSPRPIRHAWLTDVIGTVHESSRQTYGALRVHAELTQHHGVVVGHNAIAMLMRRAGLAGLPRKRAGKRTHHAVTVADLVKRDFCRDGPNQLWVTDITGHPTREGKIYCCVVIDAWSRRVVGWSIDTRQRADLATAALGMAIDSRSQNGTRPGTVIHGDHGVQFTLWAFTDAPAPPACCPRLALLATRTTTPSSSRSRGVCKPSSSTADAGTPASSSPTRSSSTWRASTTGPDVTQPWVTLAPYSSRTPTQPQAQAPQPHVRRTGVTPRPG